MRLAVDLNTRRKKSPKIAISGQSHNFVGLYLRNQGKYQQSGKKLVKQQYVLHMSSQYGELRPTSGWDRSGSLRHPCKFQQVSRLGSVTARHLVVGVSQTLRRWTEGATDVRQGDHHVGHWPTFKSVYVSVLWRCWLGDGTGASAYENTLSYPKVYLLGHGQKVRKKRPITYKKTTCVELSH